MCAYGVCIGAVCEQTLEQYFRTRGQKDYEIWHQARLTRSAAPTLGAGDTVLVVAQTATPGELSEFLDELSAIREPTESVPELKDCCRVLLLDEQAAEAIAGPSEILCGVLRKPNDSLYGELFFRD